ncbi:MAG: hypothetical protein ACRDRH_24495, partial [Pseudonocardia sp.]
MSGHGANTALRGLLDEAQMSNIGLGRAVVAAVLSARLQREVSVSECGFADCAPPGEDPYDGLRCSGTLEGTVRTIVELSGRDMRRR